MTKLSIEWKLTLSAILFASLYIGWIFYSGQTFGQRASLKYPKGSPEWYQEVTRLRTQE